jgi:hypothetical protein
MRRPVDQGKLVKIPMYARPNGTIYKLYIRATASEYSKGRQPNEAVSKLLYLALNNIAKKWTMP